MRGRLKNHGGMAAILSDFYSADYDDEYMAYKDVQRNNNISREKTGGSVAAVLFGYVQT